MLVEQISPLSNLVGGGSCSKLKLKEPLDYVPMVLDSLYTCEQCHQPKKGDKNNPSTKPYPNCFLWQKRSHCKRKLT